MTEKLTYLSLSIITMILSIYLLKDLIKYFIQSFFFKDDKKKTTKNIEILDIPSKEIQFRQQLNSIFLNINKIKDPLLSKETNALYRNFRTLNLKCLRNDVFVNLITYYLPEFFKITESCIDASLDNIPIIIRSIGIISNALQSIKKDYINNETSVLTVQYKTLYSKSEIDGFVDIKDQK